VKEVVHADETLGVVAVLAGDGKLSSEDELPVVVGLKSQ
jgi:hypothetical protein